MSKFRKGELSFFCGVIMILGHFLSFAMIWSKTTISLTAKGDLTAILVPLTVASVTSAVLFAVKSAELDLSQTPQVNRFFAFVAVVVPVALYGSVLVGLYFIEGSSGVGGFKTFIVAVEAFLGGIFVIVTEALFGSSAKKAVAEQGQTEKPKPQ